MHLSQFYLLTLNNLEVIIAFQINREYCTLTNFDWGSMEAFNTVSLRFSHCVQYIPIPACPTSTWQLFFR